MDQHEIPRLPSTIKNFKNEGRKEKERKRIRTKRDNLFERNASQETE